MDKREFTRVVNIIEGLYKERSRRVDPFEILVHGILSTRTKDTTTFPAQKRLLSVAGTPQAIAAMPVRRIERLIYPVGFYRTKAKLLKRACIFLIANFYSKVPSNKKDLMSIPGVGPKVASLVLEWGFNMPFIAVDTHVNRITQRLGAVPAGTKPERTEEILEGMLNDKTKRKLNSSFVRFGREICRPVHPLCSKCPVFSLCEFEFKDVYANYGNDKSKH